MRADELKQALKNGVYRSIGEAAPGAGVVDGIAERSLGGLVRRQLDGHLLDVPRAALNRRRACVPATVSLSAIRSHAPESTSSKVRGGYGSTL